MSADPWNTNTWAEDGDPDLRDVGKSKKKRRNRRYAPLEHLRAIGPTDAQADQKTAPTNPMKKPKIDKLINSPIEMLEVLTGQTPVTSKGRYAVRTIGIGRKGKIA
ncbi:hypothetical protein C8J57DRAFT_1661815 [Mycena rebaudengoi]|nr:hypothetical protein C8J57DRAFT_1661815 [Mycena rebaudengoi]